MAKQNLALTILLTMVLSFFSRYALANSFSQANKLIPNLGGFSASSLQTKSSLTYDETKDPALRRGTENWEQSQGSYFIIPGAVIGIIGLFLFFNRGKSD